MNANFEKKPPKGRRLVAILILAALLSFLVPGFSAAQCKTRAEAEAAVDSYIASYASSGSLIVPSDEAREQLIKNLMCEGWAAAAPHVQKPQDYERVEKLNATHELVVVFQGGKNTWNKTRPVFIPDNQSLSIYAPPTCEARMQALCAKGVTEAC